MTDATIDVVIPVWNRPNETRNCLVNLINYTPQARLIMFDSGSERETERLLQDFADGLEERALLMRDDGNVGFVRAANRGLARAEAPYLALVRNTTQVTERWLDPILEFASTNPEAGIIVPCFTPAEECHGPMEVSNASFAAMVITRKLYDEIGGFDEAMDGGLWCLRDYTRRACAGGFLTFQLPAPAVTMQEEVPLGSERRRNETLQRSLALFRERWGEGRSYLIHVPKGVETGLLSQKLDWLVQGARHGDSYLVLMQAALYKTALQAGLNRLHENVRLAPLPRLMPNLTGKRLFERTMAENPGTVAVEAVDGMTFPWSGSYLSFSELCDRIRQGYQVAQLKVKDTVLQEV